MAAAKLSRCFNQKQKLTATGSAQCEIRCYCNEKPAQAEMHKPLLNAITATSQNERIQMRASIKSMHATYAEDEHDVEQWLQKG